MRTREQVVEALVNLSEVTEIELLILKRMREFTVGEHKSQFHGSGFDFTGLRDRQGGDRFSAIDWPQSTLTNFSPLIVREFEQPSTATVVAVADSSLSTRCGVDGISIAAPIARAIATIGMSAVFFQDMFGLMTFEAGFTKLQMLRPRVGKSQVVHCLDGYQYERGLEDVRRASSISMSIAGCLRKKSLIPVISDFLFENADDVVRELSVLNSIHDVFLVLIDSAFAFDLPEVRAGWVDAFDVETGESRVISRAAFRKLAERTQAWQNSVERKAKDLDLDVLRFGIDEMRSTIALTEFVAERRLRKA